MKRSELQALADRLSATTQGVVAASELRVAGADPDAVALRLTQEWQRPLRGIYVVDDRELTAEVKGHVAVKHAGAGAVITGLQAATWLGLRWVPDTTQIHVLVEPERRRRGSEGFVLVRRCAELPTLVTSSREGLELAPPSRVVVDAARELRSLREVRGVVLGAVADRRCTAQDLLVVLDSGAVAGTALARRACNDAIKGAVSPPEAELVDGLLGYGVPFFCNVEVWLDDVLLGVADVWLVGTGVGGEMDSREFHESISLLDGTLLRDERFRRARTALCHVTPQRYRRDPEAFHRTMFEEVALRQARGLGDPEGLRLVPRGPLLCGSTRQAPPYRLPTSMIHGTGTAA